MVITPEPKPDNSPSSASTIAPPIPWFVGFGEVVGSALFRMGGWITLLLTIPGDTDSHHADRIQEAYEAQKLKRHEKNIKERGFRQSKDNKK